MDQGVIYTFKRLFMMRYYDRMVAYVIEHFEDLDPMKDFLKTYNMMHVVEDIGKAWGEIDDILIHKCFEKLVKPDEYTKQFNEEHDTNLQWTGKDFRGFSDGSSVSDRADKIREMVATINNQLSHLDITIDDESVREHVEYDPNKDIDTDEAIHSGFHRQRFAGRLEMSTDADIDVQSKAHDFLKSVTEQQITFRPDDYNSREHAERASLILDELRDIYQMMTSGAAKITPSKQDIAAAGSSRTRPSQSTSQPGEPMHVARITALNEGPRATSSPGRQSQRAPPPPPPASPSASPPASPANSTWGNIHEVNIHEVNFSFSSLESPEHMDDEPIRQSFRPAVSPQHVENDEANEEIFTAPTSSSISAAVESSSISAAVASATRRAEEAEASMWKRGRTTRAKKISYQECPVSDTEFDSSSDEWVETP